MTNYLVDYDAFEFFFNTLSKNIQDSSAAVRNIHHKT